MLHFLAQNPLLHSCCVIFKICYELWLTLQSTDTHCNMYQHIPALPLWRPPQDKLYKFISSADGVCNELCSL